MFVFSDFAAEEEQQKQKYKLGKFYCRVTPCNYERNQEICASLAALIVELKLFVFTRILERDG